MVFNFFFFRKYRQLTTPHSPLASSLESSPHLQSYVCCRDTSGCSSLSRQKKHPGNNIRMYLSLLPILSGSDSQMTEMNGRQTCADYFCIFLQRLLQKTGHRCSYLGQSANDGADKQNSETDCCTKTSSLNPLLKIHKSNTSWLALKAGSSNQGSDNKLLSEVIYIHLCIHRVEIYIFQSYESTGHCASVG